MTLSKAIKQAKKLLVNRNKLDLCKPWKGLYIVWSVEDFDLDGQHYHTATENEIDTFFAGCKVVSYVAA